MSKTWDEMREEVQQQEAAETEAQAEKREETLSRGRLYAMAIYKEMTRRKFTTQDADDCVWYLSAIWGRVGDEVNRLNRAAQNAFNDKLMASPMIDLLKSAFTDATDGDESAAEESAAGE